MPVADPTRPRHVAWEHDWDVWVRIATTTAEGTPLADSVDWDGDSRLAAEYVEGVARAWAGQLVGLSFAAGGHRWSVVNAEGAFVRSDPPYETECYLRVVPHAAEAPEPLDEEALAGALEDAVIAALDVDAARELEVGGQRFSGRFAPEVFALWEGAFDFIDPALLRLVLLAFGAALSASLVLAAVVLSFLL